jgi:hypothetical protein
MYSQQDLDDAVAAGALSADSVAGLRTYLDQQRSTPAVDEEQFRLITSFNDIFVSIAAAILIFAVGWIGQSIGQSTGLYISEHGEPGPSFLGPLLVAIISWGLAVFFTARRRMALPSILLVFAFVVSVIATVGFAEVQILLSMFDPNSLDQQQGVMLFSTIGAIAAAIGAVAAWFHWKRFRVPVTVAAGTMAACGIVLSIIAAILNQRIEDMQNLLLGFVLLLGVGVFLLAMRWDSSDPSRVTRRTDVAFWLHLLAAPMIVHPIFTLLGLNDGSASIGEGLAVIALYVVLGVSALAIDRRALLVSALAYVLYALSELFKQVGAVELNVALTALIIGSSLLLLSAYWHQARRLVVQRLPDSLRARLPNLDRAVTAQQAA